MNISEFDYELPKELIAQTPLKDRSSSRLLVLDKNSGDIVHEHFTNIIEYLHKGDVLVHRGKDDRALYLSYPIALIVTP